MKTKRPCLILLLIACIPNFLAQQVDEKDGFRSNVIRISLTVRDSHSANLNAQFPVDVYQNRQIYHSARPVSDLDISILADGTSDINLNEVYSNNLNGKKNVYENALGDAFYRMMGFASSALYSGTAGGSSFVRNIHYTLLVGSKDTTEPLPSVSSCGVHGEISCLQWVQENNLQTSSYHFNEVSLCAAAYGIGNLAEVQRARDGYESNMIKWTRIPQGKFDVVSRPGHINYFMTYYGKARFEVHLMAEGVDNCVDGTPTVEYFDCPTQTAYPLTPCVFETDVSICLVKFVGNTDNSKQTCTYYQDVLRLREANVPSIAPFALIESNNQRILNSDINSPFLSQDLTHLLPSAVSSLRSCYFEFGQSCEYRDGGWSELIFTGCADGFTPTTVDGKSTCVDLRNCGGVNNAVVSPYIPRYDLSESTFLVDPVIYKSYYDTLALMYNDEGGPLVVTFTHYEGTSCTTECKKIPDGDGSTYYTHLPNNEAITAAENLCELSNTYGEVFYPSVHRNPLTNCYTTLVEATPFTDRVCMCPTGYKFTEVMVDGIPQLDITSCVPCTSCAEGKIALVPCGTAWRYYVQRVRNGILKWPLVDPTSQYTVNPNLNAVDKTFTYFNIDQVCGDCNFCNEVLYHWTDCSGLTRQCRPCNCNGNIPNDQVCILDACSETYSDKSVLHSLSSLTCSTGHWRNLRVWADDENRSYTTARWKELRCVECALTPDVDRSMFDFTTNPNDPQIRCANRVDNNIYTTGKTFPSCSGTEDSLPGCEDCPELPPNAFWLYIGADNQSSIDDCEFGCVEHYEKVWDGEKYVCSSCYDMQNNLIIATNPCPVGEYRTSCGPNLESNCVPCTPSMCDVGEYISQCVNGYEMNNDGMSSSVTNQCVACDDDVTCASDKEYRRCTGVELIDNPEDRCETCTGQELPPNSFLRNGSCIGYCLPYFYHHVNADDSWTCEPCPQTSHGIQHFCCDSEEDCGQTFEVSDECEKSGVERIARNWMPTCVCKPGWEPTEDGGCQQCEDWKVSTDGTGCKNCKDGGTQGNREIGADACEECPRSYYRVPNAQDNQCKACASGTDNRTGAVYCPSGEEVCRGGKKLEYDGDGSPECGTCSNSGFWTGTYDLYGLTIV
jgi:hypothetical protein